MPRDGIRARSTRQFALLMPEAPSCPRPTQHFWSCGTTGEVRDGGEKGFLSPRCPQEPLKPKHKLVDTSPHKGALGGLTFIFGLFCFLSLRVFSFSGCAVRPQALCQCSALLSHRALAWELALPTLLFLGWLSQSALPEDCFNKTFHSRKYCKRCTLHVGPQLICVIPAALLLTCLTLYRMRRFKLDTFFRPLKAQLKKKLILQRKI